jgi:hypothetical protein
VNNRTFDTIFEAMFEIEASQAWLVTRQAGDPIIPVIPVPYSLNNGVIILLAIFIAITWTVVLLRFFTKFHFLKLGNDDWFLLAAMVVYLPVFFTALLIHALAMLYNLLQLYHLDGSSETQTIGSRVCNIQTDKRWSKKYYLRSITFY